MNFSDFKQLFQIGFWQYDAGTEIFHMDEITSKQWTGLRQERDLDLLEVISQMDSADALKTLDFFRSKSSHESPQDYVLEISAAHAQVKYYHLKVVVASENVVMGTSSDISALYSRLELQRQENIFLVSGIINQSPAAMAMFDRDIKYIAASKKWYQDYGLTLESIIGKSHYEVFPEIGDDWKQIHQEALQGIVNRTEKARFPRENGTDQWIMWDVRPWYDLNGQVGGILMLTADLSEEVNSKIKLERSERKFRTAFEVSGSGMAMTDLCGKWLSINSELKKILGYSQHDLIYHNIVEIVHPDDQISVRNSLASLDKGEIAQFIKELRFIDGRGEPVWILLAAAVASDENDQPESLILHLSDINLLKQTEAKLQKTVTELSRNNQVLKQFAYIASHDLNEPLNSILSMIKLMEYDFQDMRFEYFDRYVHFISSSAKRMSNLILDLKDYVSLNKTADMQEQDLNDILKEVLEDSKGRIEETNAEVLVDHLPTIKCSRNHVRILFQNLLHNAIKFQFPGTRPVIHISYKYGQFTVCDNGIGIPEDKKYEIFEIFKRVHPRDVYDGTGIGLSTCTEIVSLHGGEIWVESELDKGSVFFFTLSPQLAKSEYSFWNFEVSAQV